MATLPPLTEAIRIAVAQLFADDPVNRRDPDAKPRDPSHQALTECIQRVGLQGADVRSGKEKRIRAVLSWALDNDLEKGRTLVARLVATAKGSGGFREVSPNFVHAEPIANLRDAFASEGWLLTSDGDLEPRLVGEDLAGSEVTDVLAGYVRRAVKGLEDDALVIGTSKDLVEATAAHILVEQSGSYSAKLSFESLLGLAFVAVGLAVPGDRAAATEPARKKLERALFTAALGINSLRNKAGTGHGRPFLPEVGPVEARVSVRTMACVAELMLDALRSPRW
jgi:Abortive infection C-terminus